MFLALDEETGKERWYPAPRRRETTLTITVRHCGEDTIVAEQQVRLFYAERDDELLPVVTFAPYVDSDAPSWDPAGTLAPLVLVSEPVEHAEHAEPEPLVEDSPGGILEEARRFSEIDNRYLRDVGLNAIPYFTQQISSQFDLATCIRRRLGGHAEPRGLALACGDMTGEYGLFKRTGMAEVDAWDISEGQRDKFYENVYDGEIPVNYGIADVNEIELEPNRYDLVYFQHAYHHIEALEHVADEIRKALKPHGVLAILDYVGANFLQRTPRQRDLCGAIWRTMPERYRIAYSGRVVRELRIPPKASLPPYEAVRSEEILPILRARFEEEEMFLYAGILFPLFNGFAQHYTDSAEDREFVRLMWDLDRWLIETGSIEPNYMKAIFTPRLSEPGASA